MHSAWLSCWGWLFISARALARIKGMWWGTVLNERGSQRWNERQNLSYLLMATAAERSPLLKPTGLENRCGRGNRIAAYFSVTCQFLLHDVINAIASRLLPASVTVLWTQICLSNMAGVLVSMSECGIHLLTPFSRSSLAWSNSPAFSAGCTKTPYLGLHPAPQLPF